MRRESRELQVEAQMSRVFILELIIKCDLVPLVGQCTAVLIHSRGPMGFCSLHSERTVY